MPLDDDPGTRDPRHPLAEVREVSDARTLRALAHPVRISLIEMLSLEGPLTATEAGELIGESPTTCSFHLRQLARYGFVEEAGGGKGRARPWRMSSLGLRFSSVHDDPAAELAASALGRLIRDRMLARYRTWLETRSVYPRAWQQAAVDAEHLVWATPEELQALQEDLAAVVLPRFRDRLTDPSARPPGALPVELLLLGYPIRPSSPEA